MVVIRIVLVKSRDLHIRKWKENMASEQADENEFFLKK